MAKTFKVSSRSVKASDSNALKYSGMFVLPADKFSPEKLIEEKAVMITQAKIGLKKPYEDHPFDFEQCEKLYTKYGYVRAVIDKYVDHIVGAGFSVNTQNKELQKKIDKFLKDVNFDHVVREWAREGLLKGNGFLEIIKEGKEIKGFQVVNANNMYVVYRKNKDGISTGIIEKYVQDMGFSIGMKVKSIDFTTDEIAHLTFNKMPGQAYGLGIARPAMMDIDNLAHNEKDLHALMSRKANAPYIFRVGNPKEPADPGQLEALGAQLQFLNNKTEWAVDYNVEPFVMNPGDLGKNFETVLEHDLFKLMVDFQIPEVLLGRGNIAEGLANVQMEDWQRNIISKQQEIERVIEEKILLQFKPTANPKPKETFGDDSGTENEEGEEPSGTEEDNHIEFSWGEPSPSEVQKRITMLQGLLGNSQLNQTLRENIEREIAELLGFDSEEMEQDNLTRRDDAEADKAAKRSSPFGQKVDSSAIFACEHKQITQDYTIEAWLGFPLQTYKGAILAFIQKDKFINLLAENRPQLEAGYLDSRQIMNLKDVLTEGFDKNMLVSEVAKKIKEQVSPGIVYRMLTDNKLAKIDGEKIIAFTEEERVVAIARSETVRLAAEGSRQFLEEQGIKMATFVASEDDRVCPICASLDGKVYPIDKVPIPVKDTHPNCRCAIVGTR